MTAVEFLLEQLENYDSELPYYNSEAIIQAKEMEKEQIIDAFQYGVTEGALTNINYLKCESEADHYYNETYGSKGSDEQLKTK